tara:strand:+ start:10679 stop:12259 length:1581 start_codon:yes stop_codon:yes gene_type:complete
MSTFKKILIGVVVLLIFAGIGMVFYAEPVLEKKLREALIGEFTEQTNGRYAINLDTIHLSIAGRSVSADSITVSSLKDSAEFKTLTAASIEINAIQWFSLLDQRFPKFGNVTVLQPEFEVYARPITSATEPAKSKDIKIEGTISTFDVIIENGSGKIIDQDGYTQFSIEELNLSAREVNLNSLLLESNLPYLKDLSISGKNANYDLDEELYNFNIGDFAFNKSEQKAIFKNISFTPLVEKYKFAKIKGKQVDRFDLSVDEIALNGLNIDSLQVPKLELSSIHISGAELEVFHDKHMDPGPAIQYKPLLHDALELPGFSIGIDTIHIRNSEIRYGEHPPGSKAAGYISFNELNATLRNIRTPEHPEFDDDSLYLHVITNFMDVSRFEVNLSYATFDENDTHHLQAYLSPMDGTTLNPMLVNTAFMRIDQGQINALDLDLTFTDEKATGSLILDYDNVQLTHLDKEDNTNTNFKTRLKDFLANNLILNTSNTGKDLKPVDIDLPRPKDKAIFGYWWRALRSGLQKVMK